MFKSRSDLKNEFGISKETLEGLEADGVKIRKNRKKLEYDTDEIFKMFHQRRELILKNFSKENEYSNNDISTIFGVNRQRGMKKSNYYHSLILLHTKNGRANYDDFWENNVLHYTGMGVEGNQELIRENKTLAKANEYKIAVYLFESIDNSKNYKYMGEVMLCDTPYKQSEIDSKGVIRSVYKFPLKIKDELNNIGEEQIENDILLESSTDFRIGYDGKKVEYYTAKYERNPKLRREAIKIHGTKCMACGFDFGKKYGGLGKDYIEVHHVKPLYMGEAEQLVNPETDLVCICSNCHRMIHRKRNQSLSMEDLIKVINEYEDEVLKG